jgi:hypothetical protein
MPAIAAGQFKSRQMISNSKTNCIEDMCASVKRSAIWRRGLHAKYNDPRNSKAADTLDRLANEIHDMTDEEFSQLSSYYNWASGKWSEAVSETSRRVGFRYVDSVPVFLNHLVGILAAQHVSN